MPQGLEFAKYSLDYHTIRNYLYVMRTFPAQQAEKHVPSYARRIVEKYDKVWADRGVGCRPHTALKYRAWDGLARRGAVFSGR